MADSLDPTKTTRQRKESADFNNYSTADVFHGRPINKRTWRKFKYSWRRLFKQTKFYAVSAVAGKEIYCNFLGPSGIVLLAVKESSEPVLTWLRYPVSFRRRSRYLETFASYGGATEEGEDGKDHFTGKDMKVYSGTKDQVAKYIELLNMGEAGCVAVAQGSSADSNMAKICCRANNWDFGEE